jgi:hypothetical protein
MLNHKQNKPDQKKWKERRKRLVTTLILLTKGFYRSTYISGDTIGSRQKKIKDTTVPGWLCG